MIVREAGESDSGAIAAVENAAASHPWTEPQVRGALAAPANLAWVAESGGTVVGHLVASAAAGTGEILSLAVHPTCRRKGVARHLHQVCRQAWVDRGCVEAFLEVARGNSAALALYRSLAWSQVGVRHRYYADGQDALVMRLELGP